MGGGSENCHFCSFPVLYLFLFRKESGQKVWKSSYVIYEWSLSTNNDTGELQTSLTYLSISSKVWVAQPTLLIKYLKYLAIMTLSMIVSIHQLCLFFSKSYYLVKQKQKKLIRMKMKMVIWQQTGPLSTYLYLIFTKVIFELDFLSISNLIFTAYVR